jgi:hypothetical protein
MVYLARAGLRSLTLHVWSSTSRLEYPTSRDPCSASTPVGRQPHRPSPNRTTTTSGVTCLMREYPSAIDSTNMTSRKFASAGSASMSAAADLRSPQRRCEAAARDLISAECAAHGQLIRNLRGGKARRVPRRDPRVSRENRGSRCQPTTSICQPAGRWPRPSPATAGGRTRLRRDSLRVLAEPKLTLRP